MWKTPVTAFNSVWFSLSVMSDSLQPHWPQHTRLPCPTPKAYSNSCPSSRWFHTTTSFSVVPFSSRLQSFPASESFPKSQFFTSGGQSIGVSASTSVLPMYIQDWFPLGWTGWISLQSKKLSRVFSNATVQKPNGQYQNQTDYILWSQKWRSSIQSAKQGWELTVAQIMNSLLPNSDLHWKK